MAHKTMKTVVILFSFMILSITPTLASQHPFFEISNSEKRELVANALKINIGDSYRQVRTTLGAPTRETPITQKNTRGYIGKKIEYYAVIWKKNIVNELKDEYIMIVLNEKGLVAKVYIKVSIT